MASRDFNPLDLIMQMETDIRRSADDAMRAVRFQPCADMYETHQALVIKLELAGVRPDRLNITLSADDRVLSLSGDRSETEEERGDRIRYYHLEVYFGAFERKIVLPGNLRLDRDHIKAKYRDGFLVISIPKRLDPLPEKRVIEITSE